MNAQWSKVNLPSYKYHGSKTTSVFVTNSVHRNDPALTRKEDDHFNHPWSLVETSVLGFRSSEPIANRLTDDSFDVPHHHEPCYGLKSSSLNCCKLDVDLLVRNLNYGVENHAASRRWLSTSNDLEIAVFLVSGLQIHHWLNGSKDKDISSSFETKGNTQR